VLVPCGPQLTLTPDVVELIRRLAQELENQG
jgi:hypothetical protein